MNEEQTNSSVSHTSSRQQTGRSVHPDYRPDRFPHMPRASVFAVELLFLLAVIAFLSASASVWAFAIGAVLLCASGIVAWRYRVSFRSLFRRPTDDDPRNLYSRRDA